MDVLGLRRKNSIYKDTIPALIIGEAMSTIIPLGILVSGTTKAVAVRKRVPLVVGLSWWRRKIFFIRLLQVFSSFSARSHFCEALSSRKAGF